MAKKNKRRKANTKSRAFRQDNKRNLATGSKFFQSKEDNPLVHWLVNRHSLDEETESTLKFTESPYKKHFYFEGGSGSLDMPSMLKGSKWVDMLVYAVDAVQFLISKVFASTKKKETDNSLNFLFFLAGLLYPAEMRDTMLGDTSERFEKDVKRLGKYKAKVYLAKDIIGSFMPIVVDFARKKSSTVLKHIGLHVVVKFFFIM